MLRGYATYIYRRHLQLIGILIKFVHEYKIVVLIKTFIDTVLRRCTHLYYTIVSGLCINIHFL